MGKEGGHERGGSEKAGSWSGDGSISRSSCKCWTDKKGSLRKTRKTTEANRVWMLSENTGQAMDDAGKDLQV